MTGALTPELRFEGHPTNVNTAIGRFHIDFPVAEQLAPDIGRMASDEADVGYGKIASHGFNQCDACSEETENI